MSNSFLTFYSMTTYILLWVEKNLIEQNMNYLNNNEIVQKDIINVTNNVSTKNQCKNIGTVSGIYKIVNKVNGKYYIGSSNDLLGKYGRWYEHRSNLVKNRHTNKKLQNSWNKYGEHNFEYLLIEVVDDDKLLIVEQKYLDILKQDNTLDNDTHYNLTYDATSPMKGKVPWNKGTKGLQVSHNKGKKLSLETKKKISESTKLSMAKIYDGMSVKRKGKTLSENHKIKLSDKTIYKFINKNTGEIFTGTRYEFRKKHNVDKACLWALIVGKYKQTNGWSLNN